MKVLFITHYFAPDSGAAANRLTRLARLLAQRGHDVTVLTTLPHYPTGIVPDAYRGRLSITETIDGVHMIQVWLWTTTSKAISRRLLSQLSFMVTCILRGLFVQRPDAIFIENQPIFTGLAGWVISKLKRCGYVLNISDYWPEYLVVAGVVSERSLVYRLFRRLAILTQQSAAHIVAMWDGLVDGVHQRIDTPPPVHLIYNAVDLDRFQPQHDDNDAETFRQQYDLGQQRLVTFLGVLGGHIDLDTMLAVARHFGGRDDVRFLFVGTGAQQTTLTDALAQPAFAHCHYIEWIDHRQVPSFWAASHVTYWAMHDNELDKLRFQAKLYESLASGTPAVVAVEGLQSQILAESEGGITVKPYDTRALIEAIEILLSDDDRHQQMSHRARAYARDHFDPAYVTDRYEALLQAISDDRASNVAPSS